MYKIEKAITPKIGMRDGRTAKLKSAVANMEVDDSFFVPIEDFQAYNQFNCAMNATRLKYTEMKLITRSIKQEGKLTGWRVWRIS
jgi:hypothetical protein